MSSTGVLGGAYADGRLTREEFDQRSEAVLGARTLAELPVLIVRPGPGLRAPRAPRRSRRGPRRAPGPSGRGLPIGRPGGGLGVRVGLDHLLGDLGGHVRRGGFPWPVFVMLGTGLHLLRLLVMRGDQVEEQRKRLERKARKALEEQQQRELESGGDDES